MVDGVTNILHVYNRLAPGGAELRTLDLMRHIDRRHYQFLFSLVSGRTGPLDDEVRELGGRIHHQRIGPTFGRRFRRLIQCERVNVVHSHMTLISGWIMRLASQAGVPKRIVHFRTSRPPHWSNPARAIAQYCMWKWIDRYATHILANSEATMSSMWPRWRSDPRCTVVYNGLDAQPFQNRADPEEVRRELGVPPDARLIIHVGNFTPAKNHLRLLSIFAAIHRADPSARLMLVGGDWGGSIERQVRARIASRNLSDVVLVMGRRADVPRLLQTADLMLFPSLREGFGGAVLEACVAGTPVLASDLSCFHEIGRHFPDICCLPLAWSDAQWAERSLELAGGASKTAASLQAAQDRFSGSPFSIRRSLDVLCSIWNDAAVTAGVAAPQAMQTIPSGVD
ncbi:MAG: glycosyltransferase [Pirellulales bacterium]|nr:glycosyltransferase [Pirellulales bacterium]